jgi:Lon-like ATP-dependent protease
MIIRPLWRTFSNSALCLVKKGRNGGTLNKKGADDNSSRIHKALKVIENSILERNVTDGSRARIVGIATAQRPHFPGFYKALTLKDASVIAGVTNELQNNKTTISLFYSKSDDAPTEVINSTKDVHKVGILAQIHNVIPGPNGSLTVFLFPQKRVTIDELYAPLVDEDASKRDPAAVIESGTSLSYVTVSSFKDDDYDEESIRPLLKEVVSTLNTLANMNPLVRDQLNDFMRNLEGPKELERDPAKLADFVGAISDGEVEDMQEILQSSSIEHRLKAGLKLLKNEIWNAELQSEITQDVEKKLSDKDREAFLQERLKKIQKELGIESISAEKAVEKFRKKASELSMPEYAKKVFEDEVGKLSTLRPSAQEYNLTMNYLNWLTDIPWGKKSKENLDVLAAEKVLNEDHYGLKDVKERILEFIAVGKLRGSVEGKIVCLSGPPGNP